MEYYRSKAEFFLLILEQKLLASQYLLGPTVTLADVAVFPFIRQFSLVEPAWFDCSPYANVRRWLKVLLDTEIFHTAMKKQVVWEKLS
jgi:glutathione S-transferase